ncbi:MAG: outer membrane lipid asymmetry maintenance protein MlaD [Holosporaceae bacterium]|jgi:phospholipid/cholesterol/gamma-HCH transport system substrate-binding protein|nr:outer membrane lipid asymmetry maintenance protein MlaD [Holosporaceae bacterium]
MEKDRAFETVVGFLVLVVMVFFFNYVYTRSGWKSGEGYVLTAKFDRADGLSEGGDVKISGITIGKIVDMQVDPESFFAVIKFRVPKKLRLPKDTSASVSSEGLLGGKYLSLIPGCEETALKEGDEIGNTNGAMNLETLISKFMFSRSK